ncbi:uncharacterized protein M6B38_249560 [Iris pallida]|uniref:Uncharacterized protein n=1 Tax=Iris pallida TaxID=29817 RepID=A0AAX6IKJ1_IRIPA|nr:uncharacterized protein M6B38_249560 [Iris pallida]
MWYMIQGPKYNELRGLILQEDFEEVHERVEDVKRYWDKLDVPSCWIFRPTKASMSWIGFLVDCSQDRVKMVLDEAKTITRFLYSDELLLELMRKHIVGRELVRSSMLKSVVLFITLENMVSERESGENVHLRSPRERESGDKCSPPKHGARPLRVQKLRVKGFVSWLWVPPFGLQRLVSLKITIPMIGVLHMINESDASPMRFLYEARRK